MSQALFFSPQIQESEIFLFSHKCTLHLHRLPILLLWWTVTLTFPMVGSPKSPSSPFVLTTSSKPTNPAVDYFKLLSGSVSWGSEIIPPPPLLRRDYPQWLLTRGRHVRGLPSDFKVYSSLTGKKKCSASDRTHWQFASSISVIWYNCDVAKGNKKTL